MKTSPSCLNNNEEEGIKADSNVCYWDEALTTLAMVQSLFYQPLCEKFVHIGGYAVYQNLKAAYGSDFTDFHRNVATINLVCLDKTPVTPFVSSANYVRPNTFLQFESIDPYLAGFYLLSNPCAPEVIFHLMQPSGDVGLYDRYIKPNTIKFLNNFIVEPPVSVDMYVGQESKFRILVSSVLDTLLLKLDLVYNLQNSSEVLPHDLDLIALLHLYVNGADGGRGSKAGRVSRIFGSMPRGFHYPVTLLYIKSLSFALRGSLHRYTLFSELDGISKESPCYLPSLTEAKELLKRIDLYLINHFSL
ncbi:hypothetical protein GW755_00525 [bacterium]|nr:hypothetical protein [bacterium]